MTQFRIWAIVLLVAGMFIGNFIYSSEMTEGANFKFKFGLDLSGGTHLVYRADTSNVDSLEIDGAMSALRDVIERRVNLFGVAEPLVQVEEGGAFAGHVEKRLIVELPGVTDTAEAIKLIGETPLLEFKLVNPDFEFPEIVEGEEIPEGTFDDAYITTDLTGRYLKRATLEFGTGGGGGLSNEPIVVLNFNKEGGDLFEKITGENIREILAIFLDGEPISTPVINQKISGGSATISGSFTPDEARLLVRNLNFGALPLPIELASTQTIGASLGEEALTKGIKAGMIKHGKLDLTPRRNDHLKVTFHDSCNPARGMGLFDEPRYVIKNVCNHFYEMPENTIREKTFCCGSGSGLNAGEDMELRLTGGLPRANAVKYVHEKHGVNMLSTICAIDRAALPALTEYWVPEVDVAGVHELVANALNLPGQNDRTLDLRGEEIPGLEGDSEEETDEG